jgi:hypothetical protein
VRFRGSHLRQRGQLPDAWHDIPWNAGQPVSILGLVLNPTPRERMLDAEGRPYFLWDCDLTLDRFLIVLQDQNPIVRAYWIGKLMRQAKPDDVFQFVTVDMIETHWPLLERHLGWSREFWTWLLATWRDRPRVAG